MLEGKVALVTGAAGGIGAGIARRLSAHGAQIAVVDLDSERAAATADDLPTSSIGLVGDAADQQKMGQVIGEVVERLGALNVLVNNAGVGGLDLPEPDLDSPDAGQPPLLRMSDEEWDHDLHYNLRTTFASSRAAIPYLGEGSSIINISSIAAQSVSTQLPAYGAAKAGVLHLTRTLALQLAERRVRVNAICPGLIYTRAWETMASAMRASRPELAEVEPRDIFRGIVAQMTPLGREQTPEDIGNLVAFLASDAAANITGQEIAVDGGITLGAPPSSAGSSRF